MKSSKWDLGFYSLLVCLMAGYSAKAYDDGNHVFAAVDLAIAAMLFVRYSLLASRIKP